MEVSFGNVSQFLQKNWRRPLEGTSANFHDEKNSLSLNVCGNILEDREFLMFLEETESKIVYLCQLL